MVVYILFLHLEKIFPPFSLLNDIYPIYIYFSIEKYCLYVTKINLKLNNTFDAMDIDWSHEKKMIDWIVF